MATIDRLEPAYVPWSPSQAFVTDDESYVGRHRTPGVRRLGLLHALYRGRHRRRT